MTTLSHNWEERLYNLISQSIEPQRTLIPSGTQFVPFNAEQRNAVRNLANPTNNVPQRRNSNQNLPRVNNLHPEQVHNYTDPGISYPVNYKVVASTIIIGPPGTGKTHVICAGSILQVFEPRNLTRVRDGSRTTQRLIIATFSNAGSYRVYEKFQEIAALANTPEFYERIKLVQSRTARESYAFQGFLQRIGLNEDDFILDNWIPRNERNDVLNENLIFVGTTDSLGILTTSVSAFSHCAIYDEASQLTIPQFFQVIPTHSMKSICVVGDDKQLPPVTQLAPLGVSALTYLQGMNTYQNIPIPRTRRIQLQRQYRMHPAIAQLTERILPIPRTVIPAGDTTSNNYVLPRSQYNISNLPSSISQSSTNIFDDILKPDHPLVIIDTSVIASALDQRSGRSRLNIREAEIAIGIYNALQLVYQGMQNEDIILTSPYRAQVNYFQQHDVRTGTVHQFQGQEANAVIYSLTYARPNTKSDFFSQFNLMYVGLSRAKRKLVVIGNKDALNHPDQAIQSVRDSIFNFQYISGGQGYPSYSIDPVCHIRPSDSFLSDINNYLL